MAKTVLEIAQTIVKILDSKKAVDVKLLNVTDLTVLTEYFVLCTGTSTTQIKALANEVEFKLKEEGITPERIEGYQSGNWVVLDYGAVIVHIFHTEMREFYKLERLWADAKTVDISDITTDSN